MEASNVVYKGQSYTNRNLPILNLRIQGEPNSDKGIKVILYTNDIWIELEGGKSRYEFHGEIAVGGLKRIKVTCEPAPFS